MDQVDLLRRNSSLSFKEHGAKTCVEKRYHSKFSVTQELKSYEMLSDLVESIPGVRPVSVLDKTDNTIILEYIHGPNVSEEVLLRGIAAVDEKRTMLLSVFLAARKKNVFFDFDPTNMIYDSESKQLVLIDPLCEPVIISEHAIVVFLWGLIKVFLRSKRVFCLRSFCRAWYLYYTEYIAEAGISYKTLNKQICQYIDVVIGWNKKESKDEPLKVRAFRYIVIIPLCNFIKCLFKLNVIRAG